MSSTARRVTQGLLVVLVAAGLVGMHHLLLACSAGGDGTAMRLHSPRATPPMHAHGDGMALVPGWSPMSVGTAAVDSAASGSEPSPVDCHDMLGHLCLAVLVAAMVLMIALALAPVDGSDVWALRLPPGLLAVGARAPPSVSVRLSCLCVWRC